jgi:hypothetical protein
MGSVALRRRIARVFLKANNGDLPQLGQCQGVLIIKKRLAEPALINNIRY